MSTCAVPGSLTVAKFIYLLYTIHIFFQSFDVRSILAHNEKGTLIGFTFWESQEAFQVDWPVLVKDAPSDEGEVKPPEVYMLSSAG
jgi:hypothetical protein